MARVAFLTPEFVTEHADAGGLASYLDNITRALVGSGHEAEVFVSSERRPGLLQHGRVRVQRVRKRPLSRILSMGRAAALRPSLGGMLTATAILSAAYELAKAMEARHRDAPFDAVQTSDFMATGWFVRRRPGRIHLVRCSSISEQYETCDRDPLMPPKRSWASRLEIAAVARADVAYAPSRLAAAYYSNRTGRAVNVIRPPVQQMFTDHDLTQVPAVPKLPDRYLLHFGLLCRRKGTDWLAASLGLAWKTAPDLKIAFAGRSNGFDLHSWRGTWGVHASNVIHLGALPRAAMQAVIRRADAVVLPSLVDNLPNTVIESLSQGIPVIGTRGASIDELVENGRTGELVDAGDVDALATAMSRCWRGESPAMRGFTWSSEVASEMEPTRAVEALLSVISSRSR